MALFISLKNTLLRIVNGFWHRIGDLVQPVPILIHRFAAKAQKDFVWTACFSSDVVIEHTKTIDLEPNRKIIAFNYSVHIKYVNNFINAVLP